MTLKTETSHASARAPRKPAAAGSHLQALLCPAILSLAAIASWPFAGLPWGDDFSYTKSALDFARTGHILYNGWATAMLGWQLPWGALFIKLFGFSFNVVRFSTLPFAAGCAYLFHQILVRFGLGPRLALFGASTLTLSPLFLPLATSYMTDVPGLFVILLCIWSCQECVRATEDRSAVRWLIAAAAVNVFGGTARQIAWLGALVMVPSTALLLRRRQGMVRTGVIVWLLSVAAIAGFALWFRQQPYSVPEPLLPLAWRLRLVTHGAAQLLRTLLCTLLVAFPVLAAWLVSSKTLGTRSKIVAAAVVPPFFLLLGVLTHPPRSSEWLLPWLVPVLGALEMDLQTGPAVWARLAVTLLILAAAILLCLQFTQWRARSELRHLFASEQGRVFLWIMTPFTVACLMLILPRAAMSFVQDRYVLVLLPFTLTLLLFLQERLFTRQPPFISLAVLAIFSYWSIAGNHDIFSGARARETAINALKSKGVANTSISSGIAADGWTQVSNGGHMNDFHIRLPAGAYNPRPPRPMRAGCDDWFSPFTPSIQPTYSVWYSLRDCPGSTLVDAVTYRRWLPPFHGVVLTQTLPLTP